MAAYGASRRRLGRQDGNSAAFRRTTRFRVRVLVWPVLNVLLQSTGRPRWLHEWFVPHRRSIDPPKKPCPARVATADDVEHFALPSAASESPRQFDRLEQGSG